MNRGLAWLLMAATALAMAPSPAAAAAADDEFITLTRTLRPGDRVVVTESSGQQVRGTIAQIATDHLVVATSGQLRTVREPQIEKVTRRRHGFLLGLLIGAGTGLAGGAAMASVFEHDTKAPQTIAAMTAFGAGIGAGIDAMIDLPRTVYRRPRAARLRVQPAVTPGGGSLQVALSF